MQDPTQEYYCCTPPCADPSFGWKQSCGHAIPPQLKDCSPPLDPRIPSIWNTYPGWWDDIIDYQNGMKNYSKFCTTDALFVPHQQFVEDQEKNEIPFKIAYAENMRLAYWPGTMPFVGSIDAGEVIGPPGLESVEKLQSSMIWSRNIIAPEKANKHNVLGTKNIGNVFQLKPTSWNQRMIHSNNIQPF